MLIELPEGVEQLSIQAGKIHVRASPVLFSKNLAVSAGTVELPFSPATDSDTLPFHRVLSLDPEIPARVIPGTVADAAVGIDANPKPTCSAWLNALADWALDNGQTVQVQVPRSIQAVELALGEPLVVPPHSQPYQFRTCLGIHRGTADLRLKISAESADKARQIVIPFDARKRGGRIRAGYQEVVINLPPADHAVTLSLSVAYKGYQPGDEDNDAFLFVANPEIISQDAGHAPVSGLQAFGRVAKDAAWYEARIPQPAMTGDAPLKLIAGPRTTTIFQPQDTKVEIRQDYGHSLQMTASQAGRYSFFLNGTQAFAAQIEPTETLVRMPKEYLTGEPCHLSVRDPSGTQVFLETYVLLPRTLTPQDVLQRESIPPFPTALSAQAGHRYAALKAQVAQGGSAAHMAQIALALQTLDGGYENVRLEPLTFPKVDKPDVSVIIPAYNKVEVTYSALCALLLARNEASFEVIVVDDASTDETAELENLISGITVIHNTDSQRFIRACNAGVAKARGKYVVLLNNDTEPTAGWLDALIDAFTRFPNVGLAGSRLLYPDGKLQDAGGIIWGSGNPWNYGNRQNPWDPRFSYARQADYLSGAALMTTRKIWDKVGGLSDYLEPMYFEDTDFAFKVREAGYTTWFVPSSVVYHYEGMSSGTDVTTGFKKYQEVNRPKFKRRWARAYAGFGPEGVNPDLEKDRGIVGRVLFIDYTTPRPDHDAGGYAAVQEIKLVQSLGYKVTFLPQNIAHLGRYTELLEQDGVEVITAPFYLSIPDFLRDRGAEFDAVYVTRYYVGRAVIDTIRQVAPKARIIFNNADLHFLRQLRTGMAQNSPEKIAEAKAVREEELEVMRKTDVVLSYNDVEHSVIQSHTDGAVKVLTCPWVVDIPPKVPAMDKRTGLSFLGSFRHYPNIEGLTWIAQEVMPQLAASHPDIVLSVYGSGMNDKARALASDNIDPVGFVADVADAYDRHRIFVAPLLSGAGIKGKVLSALAHGVPTVLTPTAAEGIGLRHGHDCMIATTPAEWLAAITALYNDQAQWTAISQNSRTYVESKFSFAQGRELMRNAFEAVDLFGSVN